MAVVKNEITNDNYIKTLVTNEKLTKKVTSIRSFNHELFLFEQEKTALPSYYDKMKMIDNINCEPFGYNHDS